MAEGRNEGGAGTPSWDNSPVFPASGHPAPRSLTHLTLCMCHLLTQKEKFKSSDVTCKGPSWSECSRLCSLCCPGSPSAQGLGLRRGARPPGVKFPLRHLLDFRLQ